MTYGTRSQLSEMFFPALLMLLLCGNSWAASGRVIHTFKGTPGKNPYSSLLFDAAGNLYGTTQYGGSPNCVGGDGGCGIVFKLTPTPAGLSYSVVYGFQGGQDGSAPSGKLAMDNTGNLYGTTFYGGDPCCQAGTVYQLTPTSNGWTKSTLYGFKNSPDGAFPEGVVADPAGNLYGTTVNGGSGCNFSCGTVFELSPSLGGGWAEQILHSFEGGDPVNPDGSYPEMGVTLGQDGNLYGSTLGGGLKTCGGSEGGCGTVFQVSLGASGWTESVIYRFLGGTADGSAPYSGVVTDKYGNVYGTTSQGGSRAGCGIVFELTPSGGGQWTETILHRFSCGGPSTGGLAIDSSGKLYGTTASGGIGYGSVFQLTPGDGGVWTFKTLHQFTGGKDGAIPLTDMTFDSDSTHLYGTTYNGGSAQGFGGDGVVFEIIP